MKIGYKLFLAFVLINAFVVVMLVGAMGYYAHKHFITYVDRLEMERLSALQDPLRQEYEAHGGWDSLKSHPTRWARLIRSIPERDSDDARAFPPPPLPSVEDEPPHRALSSKPPASDQQDRKRVKPHPKPTPNRLWIDHRISLFDQDLQLVIGRNGSVSDYSLMPIVANGEQVGWIGIDHSRPLPRTPDIIDFLHRQSAAFILTGAIMLIVASIASFFLSRHLVAPIGALVTGTDALGRREFKTRIDLATSDEWGRLAAAFNNLAATLERYERQRQQWISDISHELRTPLSVLRGEIEALQDGVRQPSPEAISSLHTEVMYLGKIVSDLHELSVAESGAFSCQRQPIDLAKVLRDQVTQFESRFQTAGMALSLDIAADCDSAPAHTDPDRLRQVLTNILENTLIHADAPGKLRVGLESEDRRYIMSFEDSGPGVPEQALPLIFDRLYKADASRHRDRSGSGLGLAICKTIVEAHGGRIHASKSSLGGLRIDINLPMDPGELEGA